MKRLAARGLLAVSAALLFAACSDEPTRPSERASSTARDAYVTSAAPLLFRQISGGGEHTCGVTTDDVVYCWGRNEVGQLGIGTNIGPERCVDGVSCSTRPVRVAGRLAFREVAAAENHSCAVTTGNVVYCWGGNAFGQLGNGTNTGPQDCIPPLGAFCSTRPVRVLGGLAFRAVTANGTHSCGVTAGSAAYCWGDNAHGELGDGTSGNIQTRPVPVVGGLSFREVNAGDLDTCGVTTNDLAFCWGINNAGQLGDGRSDFDAHPVPEPVAGGLALRVVNAGTFHTCGVTVDNVGYCWGLNIFGQLGVGSHTGPETCQTLNVPCSTRPVRVAGAVAFERVNAGVQYTCGRTPGRVAYCWGLNSFGQLGIGNNTGPENCGTSESHVPCSTRPVRVVGALAFRAVGSNGPHTCGIITGSRAYCWGLNDSGQLGDGTTTDRTRPVAVLPP